MLKNNKVSMALALVMAIVLWAYVLASDNQASTNTLRNIPITFANMETLTENNLVVLETERNTVNITFSGQRTALNKVKAENFKVIADLEGLKKGENVVRLRVVGPDNVTVESMSVQKIAVTIDDLVSVKKPVETQIINQNSDDSEPYIVQLSQDAVVAEGAASLVNKVTRLMAYVDAEKVENEMKALTIALVPVDKHAQKVEGVTLATDKVSVTAVMLNKKTVTLSVPVIGQEHDNLDISYQVPRTITIKGTDAALAAISEVLCETVDLSRVYDDTQITLQPILRRFGVTVATDSGNLFCSVTVKGRNRDLYVLRE